MLERKRSGIKTEKLVQEMPKMKGTIKGVKFCLKNFEKTTKKWNDMNRLLKTFGKLWRL